MTQVDERRSQLLIGGAAALTLSVAALLALFAHPMGDDFCDVVTMREFGLFGSVQRLYLEWHGRWLSTLIASAVAGSVELTSWYPVLLLALLGLSVLSIGLLFRAVAGPLRGRTVWWLALAFFALFFAGMPHPGQTLYWLTGAYVYSLNVSLGLLILTCLLGLAEASSWRRWLAALGLAALAVLVEGLHELVGMSLGIVLVAGTFVCVRLGDGRRSAWALVALGAFVGFAIVVFAPGNEVRQGVVTPEGQDPARAVYSALRMSLRALSDWAIDAKLLAATVLFVTARPIRSLRPRWLQQDPRLWRAAIPLTALVVLMGGFMAGGWALGRTLPYRALNSLYLMFLLGWFLTVFVWTRWDGDLDDGHPGVRALRSGALVVFVLGLFVSANLQTGIRDLRKGWALDFDREMSRRYQAAQALAGGEQALVVPEIDPWPGSFFRQDIDADPEHWRNVCVAGYLRVGSIRTAPADTAAIGVP